MACRTSMHLTHLPASSTAQIKALSAQPACPSYIVPGTLHCLASQSRCAYPASASNRRSNSTDSNSVSCSSYSGRIRSSQATSSRTCERSVPEYSTDLLTIFTSADASECAAEMQLFHSLFSAAAAAGRHLIMTIVAASLVLQTVDPGPALAILNSPNAQIPRTVDAALRRSIPAFNPSVKSLQKGMEEIAYLLRIPNRKPWGNMAGDVKNGLELCSDRDALLAGTPAAAIQQATELADETYKALKKLELAISTQQPDAVSIRVADVLKSVAALELLQAPGLPYTVPTQYANMPRLIGRATVQFTLAKANDDDLGFVDFKSGGVNRTAVVEVTLDGYSAPLSAGNFLVNVLDGLYNNRPVRSDYTSVFVNGPPEREKEPIPLEILPAGEYEPLYRLPLDVQSGELPVLPLSISGAISMAHVPGTDSVLSGADWFIYKFDKQQSGLAGLAFDEGTFGVFGYVSKGMDALGRLRTGDVIVSAKVISGNDKLVRPAASTTVQG